MRLRFILPCLGVAACLWACDGGDCPAPTTDCGGTCVDLRFDPAHCGACDTACGAGLVCANGACASGCGEGTTECTGRCVDTLVDPTSCGGCGVTCPDGEVCSAGACADACGGPTTECGGLCFDTSISELHCGRCDNPCAGDQRCVSGRCDVACPTGLTDCSGTCTDLRVDPASCGACGFACPSGQVCSESACADSCGAGTTACEGRCVDTSLDPMNCGDCGEVCEEGEVCSAGACGPTCGGGTLTCGDRCVDTMNDRANCGGCGEACAALLACVDGDCQPLCDEGEVACGGACVDPTIDASFCGDCDTACGAGQVCDAGACRVAEPIAIATTVANGQIGADAWVIFEGALGSPVRVNPTFLGEETVSCAQLTRGGDVVFEARLEADGQRELWLGGAGVSPTRLGERVPDLLALGDWDLSPDEGRFAYITTGAASDGATVMVGRVSAPGDAVSELSASASGLTLEEVQIANDGAFLARGTTTTGTQRLVHVTAAGATRTLADATEIERVELSDDGAHAVWLAGEGALFVAALPGGAPAQIPGDVTAFDLSSSGHVAFFTGSGGYVGVAALAAPATVIELTALSALSRTTAIRITDDGAEVVVEGQVTILSGGREELVAASVAAPDVPRLLTAGALSGTTGSWDLAGATGDVAFAEGGFSELVLGAASAAGDPRARLLARGPFGFDNGGLALTSDGAGVFVPTFDATTSTLPAYYAPLAGGPLERVGVDLARYGATVSALDATSDGTAAVFSVASGRAGLYLAAEGTPIRLDPETSGGTVSHAAISDDGAVVAYVLVDEARGGAVYSVTASGPGSAVRVDGGLGPFAAFSGVWIAGDRIFFVAGAGARRDLYVASLSSPGSHTRLATDVVDVTEVGDTLYFLGDVGGPRTLARVAPGDTAPTAVSSAGPASTYTISGDGAHAFYVQGDVSRIFHAALSPLATPTALTTAGALGAAVTALASDADGSHLALLSDARVAGVLDVFLIDRGAGASPVQLNQDFASPSRAATDVAISPSGDAVVFLARARVDAPELFLVDPDSPQTSQLLLHSMATTPSVSAIVTLTDERAVFLGRLDDDDDRLYAATLAAPGAEVTLADGRVRAPIEVEGGQVFYRTTRSSFDTIWRVPVTGGDPTRIGLDPLPYGVSAIQTAGEGRTCDDPVNELSATL